SIFCFVGSGPLEESILKLKESGFNVVLMRNKTQNGLRKIYNQSQWFLFPSRNEPFGLVVTESIFCGTPVITSRNGGIKEQVVEGNNGFYLKSLNVQGISTAID